MMVLSGISPLFILWAVRGNSLIPEYCFLGFCAFMVIVPSGYLWWRIVMAKKLKQLRPIAVGKAEDHRDHLLVYLFAMLLPFYTASVAWMERKRNPGARYGKTGVAGRWWGWRGKGMDIPGFHFVSSRLQVD